MDGGIFVGFERAIMNGFHSVLDGLTSTYSAWMAGLFLSALTLYLTIQGYKTLAGRLERPVEAIVWDVARMAIIMAFVINAGGWLDVCIAAIEGIRDGVSGDVSIWGLLDTVWGKAQILGETLYQNDEAGMTGIRVKGSIAELVVWGGVMFMAGATALVNLVAELIMMMMTVTAPLFIFCLIWGFLRPMFDNWLKNILSCILTVLFCALALQVVLNYINAILDYAVVASPEANIITLAFQVGIAAVGAGVIMMLMAKLASALAGASAQLAAQGMAAAGVKGIGNIAKSSAGPAAAGARLGANGAGTALDGVGKGMDHIAGKAAGAYSSYANTRAAGQAFANSAAARREASIQTVLRMNEQRASERRLNK